MNAAKIAEARRIQGETALVHMGNKAKAESKVKAMYSYLSRASYKKQQRQAGLVGRTQRGMETNNKELSSELSPEPGRNQ